MMPIKTPYGSIRPWDAPDVTALVRHANNRNVSMRMRDAFPFPYTIADANAFLGIVARQSPVTFFAIATPDEAIGGIGITRNADVHRLTAEMGYWLAEPFWGRGIMSETARAFSDFAFEAFGLIRIYAEPYEGNIASCRVLEKAGFTLEGRMRGNVIKDGRILDQYLYAKIRE